MGTNTDEILAASGFSKDEIQALHDQDLI